MKTYTTNQTDQTIRYLTTLMVLSFVCISPAFAQTGTFEGVAHKKSDSDKDKIKCWREAEHDAARQAVNKFHGTGFVGNYKIKRGKEVSSKTVTTSQGDVCYSIVDKKSESKQECSLTITATKAGTGNCPANETSKSKSTKSKKAGRHKKPQGNKPLNKLLRKAESFIDGNKDNLDKQKIKDVIKQLKQAAEQGHAEASFYLGEIYISDELVSVGVGGGPKQAVKHYKKACEEEDYMRGCTLLGRVYEERRRGVRRNYSEAVYYYKKACGKDYWACVRLGLMHEKGRVGVQQYRKAVKYYESICNGEDYAWACISLAEVYEKGRGVQQSDHEALKYYRKACDKSLEWGCANVRRLQ